MLLGGGVRGMLRAELRLADQRGTLWLETDSAPVPLTEVHLDGATVRFALPGRDPITFAGEVQGSVLHGTARADTGAPRLWTATRLQQVTEYYPSLPRFTLRQIISGRRDTVSHLPGMWVAAARAQAEDLGGRYERLARAAGMTPLAGAQLAQLGPQRALGLVDRARAAAASRATLEQIRRQIPGPETQAAFDRIFRPRGHWLVDVHDAALAFAQAASPGAGLADVRSALTAIGWFQADSALTDADVMSALYRLHGLMSTDSAQVNPLLDAMRRADPRHATAAVLLLHAYDAADQWHASALRFLLEAPWIGAAPSSIAARMRASWGDSLPLPAVESRYFGSPQAVPRYGVSRATFRSPGPGRQLVGAAMARTTSPGDAAGDAPAPPGQLCA